MSFSFLDCYFAEIRRPGKWSDVLYYKIGCLDNKLDVEFCVSINFGFLDCYSVEIRRPARCLDDLKCAAEWVLGFLRLVLVLKCLVEG
jgi:hypothetical protein